MTETDMTLISLTLSQRTKILASVRKCILKHHFNVGRRGLQRVGPAV